MTNKLADGLLRPITMQDVRLAAGEGKLMPADVLAGCNVELRRRAIHSRPVAAPETGERDGWRLVPVELTEAMIESCDIANANALGTPSGMYRDMWAAMLSAAPPAPSAMASQSGGDALREALKPFVQHWAPWMDAPYWKDSTEMSTFARVTFGDIRRARAALSATQPSGDAS